MAGLGALHQGLHLDALAFVRVLAGHDIAHQAHVRFVDHQAVTGQRRAPMPAQRLQPLVAGRQVIAVDDAQLPAPLAGSPIELFDNRTQALRAGACTEGRSPSVTNVINSTMVENFSSPGY